MNAPLWRPVREDGLKIYEYDDLHCGLSVYADGSVLCVSTDAGSIGFDLPDNLRLCEAVPLPGEPLGPDWAQAPEWAQWWTVDSRGRALWHMREPQIHGHSWRPTHGYSHDIDIDIPLGVDWRLLKVQRPQGEEHA